MKKIILLKAPLILWNVIAFIVAIYAAVTKIEGMGYATGIFLGIILGLYGFGMYLERKEEK